MDTIRIHTQLNSTTLELPELLPLLGKRVEIVVQEEVDASVSTYKCIKKADAAEVQKAIEGLEDYDFNAWRELRDIELRHANDRLP